MLNAATLQLMNEEKKKNKSIINVDEKSATVNMQRLVKKKFEKKKKNFQYMMFENLVVKNSNVRISTKHYIDNTTLFSSVIENFSFEFKNVSDEESNV